MVAGSTVIGYSDVVVNYRITISGIVADRNVSRTAENRIVVVINSNRKAAGSSIAGGIGHSIRLSSGTQSKSSAATQTTGLYSSRSGTVICTDGSVVAYNSITAAGIGIYYNVSRTADNGIFIVLNRYGEGAGSSVTRGIGHRIGLG